VSSLGAGAGLLLAWPAIRLLKAAMPEDMARVATIGLDLRVLVVAAGLALLTGLLSGIVPAVQASRITLVDVLNPGSRGGAGTQRRIRSALVVVEMALAVVLLVGASLFVGSFVNVMRVDLGFQSERVLTLQIFPRPAPGASRSTLDLGPTFDDLVRRIGTSPGVVAASAAAPGIPLHINSWVNGLTVRGRSIEGDVSVSIKVVTPDYHRALAIPLRSGRLFNVDDRTGGADVVILSEAAARRFFADEPPVGRIVALNRIDRTVVGVVADARQSSLEANPHPEVYLPMTQSPTESAWLVIKTTGDPYAVLPAIRTLTTSVLPDDPLRSIASMDELVAGQTAARRLNMLVLGLLGALGLVISAVGVFGVMAYLVAQRTREIGVRMALGATRARVVSMVVTEAAGLGIAGTAIGGAGAWYLASGARRFLFGLEPHDLGAFVVPVALALVAALAASALPARRAAGVDPTVALRTD
jgi:putative ABC transport system permease protein